MKRNEITWARFIPALLSLLLAVGVSTVFSACGIREDGTWMRCHDAGNTVTILAAVLTAVQLAQALVPFRALRMVFNTVSVIGAGVTALIPGVIMPLCMMHTMRCYTVMTPFVRILSVLIALSGAGMLIRELRRGKA